MSQGNKTVPLAYLKWEEVSEIYWRQPFRFVGERNEMVSLPALLHKALNIRFYSFAYQTSNQSTKKKKQPQKNRTVISVYRRHKQEGDKMRHLPYQASLWYELQTNRIWLWTRWLVLQGSPQPQHQCSSLASHAQMHYQKEQGKLSEWYQVRQNISIKVSAC